MLSVAWPAWHALCTGCLQMWKGTTVRKVLPRTKFSPMWRRLFWTAAPLLIAILAAIIGFAMWRRSD